MDVDELVQFMERNDTFQQPPPDLSTLHGVIRSGNLEALRAFLETKDLSRNNIGAVSPRPGITYTNSMTWKNTGAVSPRPGTTAFSWQSAISAGPRLSKTLNDLDTDGQTPLLLACTYAPPKAVEMLLERGADVNLASTRTLSTPLIAACLRGSVDHARILLDAGADVNAAGQKEGTTPLIVACSGGSVRLVSLLIERDANIDVVRARDQASAFYVAWTNRHFEVLKLLLSTQRPWGLLTTDRNRETALGIIRFAITTTKNTAAGGNAAETETVRLLVARLNLRTQADVPNMFEFKSALAHLLLDASTKGNLDLVRILLEQHRVDPNNASLNSSETPLLMALRKGHYEVARLLLAYHADPNTSPDGANIPLHACVQKNDLEGAKLLLSSGTADVQLALRSGPLVGHTPLRIAMHLVKNDKLTHLLLCVGATDLSPAAAASLVTDRDLSGLSLSDSEANSLLTHDSPRVTTLNLANNLLFRIDLSLWGYHSLVSLRLANNRLQELPRNLSILENLNHLDLSSNAITDLNPLREDHPPRLASLILRGNPLTTLPLWLHRLSSLQALDIDPNSNLGVPLTVLRLPTPDLLQFLRAIEHKSIRWNTAKLMLVGEENVGKTSLAQFLLTDLLVDPSTQHNVSTNGIAISDWTNHSMQRSWRSYCSSCFEYFSATDSSSSSSSSQSVSTNAASKAFSRIAYPGSARSNNTPIERCPKCSNGTLIADSLTLSVWDFGGQEVFYPTHSLFLSDRSIYLVVFDCSKNIEQDHARMEYWLRQINALAKNRPPILLVGTHRDQRHEASVSTLIAEVESKYKQSWGGNVRAVHAVSCVKRIGLDDLRRSILEFASKLLSNQQVPAYYLALKQLLIELKSESGSDYIRFAAFEQRARERIGSSAAIQGPEFERDLRTALLFFTDCGTVLYFDTPDLRDLVILDPRWLASVFSTIITFRPNFVNKQSGMLSLADLRQLWRAYPTEIHSRLLGILSRFGIVYAFQSYLLFPDLVSASAPPEPKQPPKPGFEFGRLYRFQFLPLGFFSRVVVGLFTSFGIPAEYELWKNGLTFAVAVDAGSTDDVGTKARAVTSSISTSTNSNCLLRFRYDTTQNELSLSVQAATVHFAERALKLAVEVIEATLSGFYSTYSNQLKRLMVCSHCTQQRAGIRKPLNIGGALQSPSERGTVFSLEDFANAVLSGRPSLVCKASPASPVPVPLNNLAPDLALTDLPVLSDVTTDKLLGKGGFGQVFRGRWQAQDVAVKELTSSDSTESEHSLKFLSFQKEVAVMSLLQHPNLLQLYGIMLQPLRMVLELAPLGDLYYLLHDTTNMSDAKLTWRLRLRIALDIAQGMNYLHQLSPAILHRDLRSPNIFLMSLDEHATVVAKVADFGLAQKLTTSSGITDRLETWQWMAPEAFGLDAAATYDERADVYSFGIILWELSTRQHPFEEFRKMNIFKLKHGICKENDPIRPTIDRFTCPARISSIIRSCWASTPSLRPAFFDLVFGVRQALLALTTAAQRTGTPIVTTPESPSVLVPTIQQPGKLLVPVSVTASPAASVGGTLPHASNSAAYVVSMHLADGGKKLWAGTSDGTVLVFNTGTGATLTTFSGLHTGRVYRICELVIANVIATAAEDLVVNLWSNTMMGLVGSIRGSHSVMMRSILVIHQSAEPTASTTEALWTSDVAGKLNAWNIQAGGASVKLVHKTVLSGGDSICSMCQAQDSGVIVGCDGTLLKLAPSTMRELHRRPKVHRGRITEVARAQEDLVATASEDYSIGIWNLSLEQLHRVTIHTGKLHALAVYQDVYLMSGGFDLQLCIYDLRSKMVCGRKVWSDSAVGSMQNICTDSISALCCDSASSTMWLASRDGSLQQFQIGSRRQDDRTASPTWVRHQKPGSGSGSTPPSLGASRMSSRSRQVQP